MREEGTTASEQGHQVHQPHPEQARPCLQTQLLADISKLEPTEQKKLIFLPGEWKFPVTMESAHTFGDLQWLANSSWSHAQVSMLQTYEMSSQVEDHVLPRGCGHSRSPNTSSLFVSTGTESWTDPHRGC